MNLFHKLFLFIASGLLILSCGKWVDVKPSDRLGEDQLFVNEAGFMKALNGVYVEMTHDASYGETLTAGAVDVLAQYYYLNTSTHSFQHYSLFNYTDVDVKDTFDATWRKAYELIANCNVILEKLGDSPSAILAEPYYSLIKGETLALRAFLHLDMLRLFGPIYADDTKSLDAIPYADRTTLGVFPMQSAAAIVGRITDDLHAALLLLADVDPIRKEGVRNSPNPTGPNDFYYRQYRLNYYATKGLLARAYLWQGDHAQALLHAEALLNEVRTEDKNIFPSVTFANATHAERPDRVFSTEVMFGLYDIGRQALYTRLFDVNLPTNRKLSFSAGDVNDLRANSVYDDANDFRRRIWQNASTGTITATTNMKYADVVDGPGRYMIPLIRLSEMLLIAAECHPDLEVGIAYLNQLRNARNSVSIQPGTKIALLQEITKEHRREMLGEGQQFFYYKRHAAQTVPNHATPSITPEKTMVLSNYVVPIPDSEISQR